MPHKDPERARKYHSDRYKRRKADNPEALRAASRKSAKTWYHKNKDAVPTPASNVTTGS